MRTAFFVLVLANVALFAYFWTGAGDDAKGEAQIIAQQLNPEKIRLLGAEQASALVNKPEPVKATAACLEWGAFSGGDVTRAAQALDPLELGAKLAQRRLDEVAGFWVYIAPLGSRQ